MDHEQAKGNVILILADRDMTAGSGEWRLITARARTMWEDLGIATIIYCLDRSPNDHGTFSEIIDGVCINYFRCRHFWQVPIVLARMGFRARDLLVTVRPRIVVFSGILSYPLRSVLHPLVDFSIVDIHGVLEEWLEYPPDDILPLWLIGPVYRIAKVLEGYIVRRCSLSLVVSEPLMNYVRSEYGQERVVSVPCGVFGPRISMDNYRALRGEWRRRLNLGDNLAVVYSGGLSRWQMIEKACDLFRLIRQVRRDSRLILITTDSRRSRRIAEDAGVNIDEVLCITLSPAEAVDALAACDVGVLLRKTNTTNMMAFPNKFAEYIRSGLAIVTSPGLLQPAGIVEHNNIGILLDPEHLDSQQARGLVRDHLMSLVKERERDMKSFYTRCWRALDSNINMRQAIGALHDAMQRYST